MNTTARLFYHLQEKEEDLLAKSKQLESAAHELQVKEREVDLSKKEQEAMFRIFQEKMENTKLLFQIKLENLNTLLQLKEEGWQQQFGQMTHESNVQKMVHQNEMNQFLHESKVKDWLHSEEVDRLNHAMDMKELSHETERKLDELEHQRKLFDFEKTIAEKIQDIHLMQQEIQELNSSISIKDGVMKILKEQSVLENKRGQLKDQQLSIETANRKQLEQMSSFREEYWQKLNRINESINTNRLVKKDISYTDKIQQLEREIEELTGRLNGGEEIEESNPMLELKMEREQLMIQKLTQDMAYRQAEMRQKEYERKKNQVFEDGNGLLVNGFGEMVGVY